jgi:hypothetical protein
VTPALPALLLLVVPPADRGMKPMVLTPPPGFSLSAQSCVDCHSASHDEWAQSRHATASTNALFTASFARQTRTWCLNCHAPLAEQRDRQPQLHLTDLGREGVNCAACHVREGRVVTARAITPAAEAAHPMLHDAELATSEQCAGCHDFNVPWVNLPQPVKQPGYSAVPMQDTFDEWRTSVAASRGVGCVECHMPKGSHAVTGARDVAWLKRALRLDASNGADGVDVALEVTGAAHAFPTGDPFRALRFELCDAPTCETPLATHWLRKSIEHPAIVPAATRSETAATRFTVRTAVQATHWRLVLNLAEPQLSDRLPRAERELEVMSGRVR